MVGVSYGGGIQLVTAAIDNRVDAIVPTIAWHCLDSGAVQGRGVQEQWATLLAAALASPSPARIRESARAIYGDLTGVLRTATRTC